MAAQQTSLKVWLQCVLLSFPSVTETKEQLCWWHFQFRISEVSVRMSAVAKVTKNHLPTRRSASKMAHRFLWQGKNWWLAGELSPVPFLTWKYTSLRANVLTKRKGELNASLSSIPRGHMAFLQNLIGWLYTRPHSRCLCLYYTFQRLNSNRRISCIQCRWNLALVGLRQVRATEEGTIQEWEISQSCLLSQFPFLFLQWNTRTKAI